MTDRPTPSITGYCPACGRGDVAPTADDWEQQRKRAEAAVTRVREAAALHRQGLISSLELYAVIDTDPQPAPAHNAGPSVRECAAQDAAHWNDKYAGEGR
ncbi:MAG: hypothetical protein LBV60_19645 [Streptomyces sp.]|jgi:hypothetical protein|nr:hypothetical protein [Streptomyces sp.]